VDLFPGYREIPSPPALRAAISCLWVRVGGSRPAEVRVLPDAGIDVIWRAGRGVIVAGPDTEAKLATLDADAVLVGVRFAPGAAGAALGLPMHVLRDLRVDAADVAPRFVVDPDATPEEALAGLLDAIAPVVPDRAVQIAARRVASVAQAARDYGLSERQLRRRSLAAVGYGPKTLARVLRFQRFLAAADAAPGRSPADLALTTGYADQAHLTRDCTRFAGLAPAALRRSRAPAPAPAPPAAGGAAPAAVRP
jgi:AraC-like DNA-binding protein